MFMKKVISSVLIQLALWLYPDYKEKLAPSVDGYIAGKLGLSVEFGKHELKEYIKNNNTSHRKAMQELIKEHKKYIKVYVAKAIGDMMEFDIDKHKNGATVSGHVKVYKKDGCIESA